MIAHRTTSARTTFSIHFGRLDGAKIVRENCEKVKEIKPCIQINIMILYYHQINLQAPGITLRCRRYAKLSVEDEISTQKHDAGADERHRP